MIEPLSERQYALLDLGIINLNGKIEEATFVYLREALLELRLKGSPPIEIQIFSDGGDFDFGLSIYDLLCDYQGQVTGIVSCYCCSVAVLILQACDKRLMHEHAKIMIHHPLYLKLFSSEFLTLEMMMRFFERNQKLLAITPKILIESTKRNEEEICIALRQCQDMSAEQALEFGLIDEIVFPKPKRSPKNG
jgi:ATP-dependent Clp protease protease subunit